MGKRGAAWNTTRVDRVFKRCVVAAKVRTELTPYALRHLYISQALMQRVAAATVAQLCGTSIAMIERTYGHFSDDHLTDAALAIHNARKSE